MPPPNITYESIGSEDAANNEKVDVEEIPDANTKTALTSSVLLYTAAAALNSCTLGYDLGVNTSAALLVQTSLKLTDVQIETFVGAMDLFAMVGAASAHVVSERHGRRGLFGLSAAGFATGATIMALSVSYEMLMVGRAMVGLCVGFGLAVDPIYISEISPQDRRGELVSWSEIALNIGIIFGFAAGLILYPLPEDVAWRFMFGVGSLLPITIIALLCTPGFIPESPRWLVQKGREDEATAVLQTIYPPAYDVSAVVAGIKESIQEDVHANEALGWAFLLKPTPAYRRMLMVGIGTAVGQQLVGVDAIGSFLVYIMNDSGMTGRLSQSLTLMALQFLKLMVVLYASKLFDTKGRRFFLFLSLAGTAASLLVLSINFLGETNHSTVIAVIGLASYLCFFSVGMGPMAWLIPSEVFSNTIRAKAMSLATLLNRLVGTLLSSSFLSLASALTWSGLFAALAVVCALVAAFFFFYLPETKGRALEDMAVYFAEVTGDRSILEMEASLADGGGIEAVGPLQADKGVVS